MVAAGYLKKYNAAKEEAEKAFQGLEQYQVILANVETSLKAADAKMRLAVE